MKSSLALIFICTASMVAFGRSAAATAVIDALARESGG